MAVSLVDIAKLGDVRHQARVELTVSGQIHPENVSTGLSGEGGNYNMAI